MIFSFNRARVLQLIKATATAPVCHKAYSGLFGTPHSNEPGLNLVGDQGVYLMSNRLAEDNRGAENVAYARECNPRELPFSEWYENKRVGFGGDDGIIHIPLPEVEAWVAETTLPFVLIEVQDGRITLKGSTALKPKIKLR